MPPDMRCINYTMKVRISLANYAVNFVVTGGEWKHGVTQKTVVLTGISYADGRVNDMVSD